MLKRHRLSFYIDFILYSTLSDLSKILKCNSNSLFRRPFFGKITFVIVPATLKISNDGNLFESTVLPLIFSAGTHMIFLLFWRIFLSHFGPLSQTEL